MRVKCLAQEHNTGPQPGLEQGVLALEPSALTLRSPHLQHMDGLGMDIFLKSHILNNLIIHFHFFLVVHVPQITHLRKHHFVQ